MKIILDLFKSVLFATAFIFIIVSCDSNKSYEPVDPYIPPPSEPIIDPCPSENEEISVLFIGNSFSSAVPQLLKFFADSSGKSTYVDEVIFFGRGLDFIAARPITLEKINSRDWDYVVLQASGFVIAYPETHAELYPPYGYLPVTETYTLLKNMVKNNAQCSRLIFFMPWGYEDGLTWLPQQTDTFEDMQQHIYNNSISLCNNLDFFNAPIGWAWYVVMQERDDIDFFTADMAHPTYAGSYIAACVIYNVIYRESLTNNPYNFNLEPEHAQYLKNKSSEIVLNNLSLWNIQ